MMIFFIHVTMLFEHAAFIQLSPTCQSHIFLDEKNVHEEQVSGVDGAVGLLCIYSLCNLFNVWLVAFLFYFWLAIFYSIYGLLHLFYLSLTTSST